MQAEELLQTLTDDELKRRANHCFLQAEDTSLYKRPSPEERLRFLTEADFYLKALIWRQDARKADRDKKEAEERADRDRKRENRHFWIELIVIGILIGAELYFSIHYGRLGLSEGRQQAAILQKMNKNTEDTAVQIQRAADAMTAILQVLQADRADRAKKPSPALYVGNIPIDKATVRPTVPNGPTQSSARFDLLLKNEGDASLNTSEIHALVPEGINFYLSTLPTVPEYEEPSKPGTRSMSYAVPLTPVGKSLRIDCQISAPKGHAPFKVAFTITSPQLQAVTPLGSLTVLPPKP